MINYYEESRIKQRIRQGLLQGQQYSLLLEARFGEATRTEWLLVEAITESAEWDRLFQRAITAPSLEALGLVQ